ncbi:alpha/beta hydrolase [Lentilitoribacter sp. Alg239-R112]|uniref:alpha/beta hydrolase n=1 Tax=Lentilitoribacter sp. Alg239-R112 TaxID=2305987 RepID=UPI0013A6DBC6|nr:alpha/beta hydrolase [Lentilitoribacter sp. Alg239-R112]
MAKLKFSGSLRHRISSFISLNGALLSTYIARALGQKMEPSWEADMEIGIRFWRKQFTKAMAEPDMARGRAIFDSLATETDDIYDVTVTNSSEPNGVWYTPEHIHSDATLLYLHGGGYTFNGPVSSRFASMLAHHSKARLFMPRYRLTPEHPHPAQIEDALAAWTYLTSQISADKLVIIGDSAGGHLSLMLLQKLKSEQLPQPALCIGLCPWTDIGARGDSLFENDRFDLVQGWMALKFGQWLDPEKIYGRKELSPIEHNYAGLAPLYLQTGGREILHDMICDFAKIQEENGAQIMLDAWPDMPHNFQAYDSMRQSSTDALSRIRQIIAASVDKYDSFEKSTATRTVSNEFDFLAKGK